MRDLIVLGGSSHPNLTKSICRSLTLEQGLVDSRKFSNGEISIEVKNSVREKDVFIIQSGCGHVNDNFLELLITIAACKTASAKRVTAVLPLFPYSRQPDIPYLANATGAPSISTKKEEYTFESAPATPNPLSKSSSEKSFLSLASSSIVSENKAATTGVNNISSGNRIKLPVPKKYTPKLIHTNASATNFLPQVDAYGKTESGYKQWISPNC